MMYMPLIWVIIGGTAILSSIITTALPYVPKWFNAFKHAIKRKKVFTNNKPFHLELIELQKRVDQHDNDFKDMEKLALNVMKSGDANYEWLTKQVEELKEQMDNVAKNHYTRERNRKSNIRRDVREYLKELQND